MNGTDFLTAVALLLIFEGILPFTSPNKWQEVLRSISEMNPEKIRLIGLASMMAGLFLLYLIS